MHLQSQRNAKGPNARLRKLQLESFEQRSLMAADLLEVPTEMPTEASAGEVGWEAWSGIGIAMELGSELEGQLPISPFAGGTAYLGEGGDGEMVWFDKDGEVVEFDVGVEPTLRNLAFFSASGGDEELSDSGDIPEIWAWQNAIDPADVNGDSRVTPQDLLQIINLLNSDGETATQILPSRSLSASAEPEDLSWKPDVSGDGLVSPMDALIIINRLNQIAAIDSGINLFAIEEAFDDSADGMRFAIQEGDEMGQADPFATMLSKLDPNSPEFVECSDKMSASEEDLKSVDAAFELLAAM